MKKKFAIGMQVRITKGSWSGKTGVVQNVQGKWAVVKTNTASHPFHFDHLESYIPEKKEKGNAYEVVEWRDSLQLDFKEWHFVFAGSKKQCEDHLASLNQQYPDKKFKIRPL